MMRNLIRSAAALCALSLGLAACSPQPNGHEQDADTSATQAPRPPAGTAPAVPAPPTAPAPQAAPPARFASAEVIGLEGLGELKIGEPVPKGSSWAERGAQIDDGCRTVNSPDHPGVYAIVEGGAVRRITVGKRSRVKLVEGIGVGASEAEVREFFPGFRAEPHKYEEAPAKYLTAPGAGRGGPALRFEIGHDGKVGLIHVGTMPVLGYVEGCA